LAVALMVIDAGALNVAPVNGLVIDTVGSWFCADLTLTLTPDDVRDAPSSSNAFAVRV
jgi:hypothetical protein